MASVYKKTISTTRNGQKMSIKSDYWYAKYKDENGISQDKKLSTDKVASQQLLAELVRKVELAKAGIFDRFENDRVKPLTIHIEEFKQNLVSKGNTEKHANLTHARIKAVIEACKFKMISDIKPSTVEHYISDRKNQGISVQTCNFYLKSMKQFFKWLVDDQRTGESLIQHLKCQNVNVDRRHDRRALELDEIEKLFDAVRQGKQHHNLTPKVREMLYMLALNTGLRASELASLTWHSLNLTDSEAFLIIEAAYSKHRKKDTLPLRADIAVLFKAWKAQLQADDENKLFPKFNPQRAARMLKKDLENAGIQYQDESGRFADFHCLRHTFITILSRKGVHPKIVQSLARHSKIELTMNRYTHINLLNEHNALDCLPNFGAGKPETQNQQVLKTGTYDLPFEPKNTDTNTDETAYFGIHTQSLVDNINFEKTSNLHCNTHNLKSIENKNLGIDSQGYSQACKQKNGEGGIRTPGTSVHRYDGLANRCLKPLGHLSIKQQKSRKTCCDKSLPTLHKTGRYCKKIKGKIYYFGTDQQFAYQKYIEQASY